MNVKKLEKELKTQLKEMGVVFDELSILSERVPNLFFTFCKGKDFTTRYFLINGSSFSEISKNKYYQLGQEALRALRA